jgi:hypothetical protein
VRNRNAIFGREILLNPTPITQHRATAHIEERYITVSGQTICVVAQSAVLFLVCAAFNRFRAQELKRVPRVKRNCEPHIIQQRATVPNIPSTW